jgi:hypothetical protein
MGGRIGTQMQPYPADRARQFAVLARVADEIRWLVDDQHVGVFVD